MHLFGTRCSIITLSDEQTKT